MIKRALLVGINAYPGAELRGCLNDVKQIHELLTGAYGFEEKEIRILRDREATSKGIEAGLAWLAEGGPGGGAGDVRVFHYSGHGTYVPDENGDERDGRDEALCPIDCDNNGFLTDDRLASFYAAVPEGSNLTLLMDCCHSGTIQKEPQQDALYRFLPVSHEVMERIEQARERFEAELETWILARIHEVRSLSEAEFQSRVKTIVRAFRRRRARFGDVSNREGNILLSGCMSTQTSADAYIARGYHGAFTYYLVQAVKRLGAAATYREVAAAVGAKLRAEGFRQVPQLEGRKANKDAPMFAPFSERGRARPNARDT